MPAIRQLAGLGTNDRGIVAIEFALIMPVFLLITYCFMELGRILFIQNSLGHAVYEAERYAIVHGSASSSPATADSIEEFILASSGALDADNLTVTVTFTPDNAAGSLVEIDATYDFDFMTALIPINDIDLQANTIATIAY
jgi:Flp pilus assembly protein TadG